MANHPHPWLELLNDLYAPPTPDEARGRRDKFDELLVELGLTSRAGLDDDAIARAARDSRNHAGRHILVTRLFPDAWKAWDPLRHAWSCVVFIPEATALPSCVETGSARGRAFAAFDYAECVAQAGGAEDAPSLAAGLRRRLAGA